MIPYFWMQGSIVHLTPTLDGIWEIVAHTIHWEDFRQALSSGTSVGYDLHTKPELENVCTSPLRRKNDKNKNISIWYPSQFIKIVPPWWSQPFCYSAISFIVKNFLETPGHLYQSVEGSGLLCYWWPLGTRSAKHLVWTASKQIEYPPKISFKHVLAVMVSRHAEQGLYRASSILCHSSYETRNETTFCWRNWNEKKFTKLQPARSTCHVHHDKEGECQND